MNYTTALNCISFDISCVTIKFVLKCEQIHPVVWVPSSTDQARLELYANRDLLEVMTVLLLSRKMSCSIGCSSVLT